MDPAMRNALWVVVIVSFMFMVIGWAVPAADGAGLDPAVLIPVGMAAAIFVIAAILLWRMPSPRGR